MADASSSSAKVYTTNHSINRIISGVLAQGFNAQQVPPVTLLPGLAICYGILRGTGDIIKQCEIEHHEYLYVDHSFFGACRNDHVTGGKGDGYYRCIKNGRYANSFIDVRSTDRFKRLGLRVMGWRKGRTTNHIVVVPLSSAVGALTGIDPNKWLQQTMARLATLTTRDIMIKPKDTDLALPDVLHGSHALVTLDSNAAVDAALMGVPVFTSRSNAAGPVANFDLAAINTPAKPPREGWLASLAYMQFTLDEIADGTAKRILYG